MKPRIDQGKGKDEDKAADKNIVDEKRKQSIPHAREETAESKDSKKAISGLLISEAKITARNKTITTQSAHKLVAARSISKYVSLSYNGKFPASDDEAKSREVANSRIAPARKPIAGISEGSLQESPQSRRKKSKRAPTCTGFGYCLASYQS